MRLYHSPTTPYGRKVMVMILEAGLQDRIEVVSATGSPLDPGTMPLERNPLGKIPALERDDGSAIYDSRVICRYLDATFATGLYPEAPRLWDTLVLEATADGILDAALLMAYETRLRPEEKRFPDWVDAQWQKIDRALAMIETERKAQLSGPLDMAHLALGCALGYLDFRHAARQWRQGRPALAAWAETLAARPSMRATEPPPA